MVNPPKRSTQQSDERSTLASRLERRHVLQAGTATVLAAVAGCLTDETTDDDDEWNETADGDTEANASSSSDDADGNGDADSDAEMGPEAVVDASLEAAADEDTDAIDELMHSLSPFNPADWEEDGWEFRGGDGEDVDTDEYKTTVVTEDGSIDDILALEGAEFWFADTDLEAEIGDEDIALVELEATDEADSNAEITEASTWVLVTENDEWRILFMGAQDDTPENPEEAFEEEIIDEEGDVVEEIDWEYEQANQGDENGLFGDLEWAQVVLADDPGIDADTVRVESTIEGSEFELYDGPDSWSGSWVNVGLNPDGDQIVVTAIEDGEETVVHREHYEPESDSEANADAGADADDES